MRVASTLLAVLLIAASAPHVIIFNADNNMDSPQPKAPLSQWQDAPGRKRVELLVKGAILRGYSYTGKVERGPVIVMFGGSGNMVKAHDAAARGFARHASRVVWYDYRGYGFSGGAAHYDDLLADSLRVYDSVLAGSDVKRVVPFGYSMGTAIAENVALNRPVAGYVLAAPWSDFNAVLRYQDPKHSYRLTPQAAGELDEVAMVRRIRAPLLVFQGTRDDGIPPTQGPRLERDAASPDKRFVAIVGAKHNGLLENPQSQAAVADFLMHVTNL